MRTDWLTFLLSLDVCRAEITTLSDTALESATDAAVAAEVASDSAVEIKRLLDAIFESLVVWSVEVTTESETALLSATEARVLALSALESATLGLPLSAVDCAVEINSD